MIKKHQFNRPVVIGLGATGVSCIAHLLLRGYTVAATDSRDHIPGLDQLAAAHPEVEIVVGGYSSRLLNMADAIIVSPGVDCRSPIIAQQVARGVPIFGDIELFAMEADAPILAITGSNGKTTAATLLGKMIEQSGYRVEVCGNIGLPVLDVLRRPTPDYYVLELSSFQLQTTYSLRTKASVILNISPDHLDRHQDFPEYLAAKQRIYINCEFAVINQDQPELWQSLVDKAKCINFSVAQQACYCLRQDSSPSQLQLGAVLFPLSRLALNGRHHWQNALAVCALAASIKLPTAVMCRVLEEFKGLEHRCEWVANHQGVDWYNDSKATLQHIV